MLDSDRGANRIVQAIAVLVIGLGVGWLSGLSVSPVIDHVLGALLGLGAGLVAALRMFAVAAPQRQEVSRSQVDAFPAALLIAGIAIGAPLGIVARTHGAFEPGPVEVSKSGANQPSSNTQVKNDQPQPSKVGALYGSTGSPCGELLGAVDSPNLQTAMQHSTDSWARAIGANEQNQATLRAIVEAACAQ